MFEKYLGGKITNLVSLKGTEEGVKDGVSIASKRLALQACLWGIS